MIKSKAYIASTIIIAVCLLLMAAGINFLPGLLAGSDGGIFGGGEAGDDRIAFGITRLYVSDQSGIEPPFDFNYLLDAGLEVIMIAESEIETIKTQLHDSLEAEILIEVTRADRHFNILASRPQSEEKITASDCSSFLGSFITTPLWVAHILSLGVAQEDIFEAAVNTYTQVTVAGEAPRNEIAVVIANTALPMVSALVLFMFIFLYGQFTAQSIATEKTSRVMETLLTSVRPMAIILGKVLGMGLASLTQFFALAISGVAVTAIVAPFGTLGQVFGSVEIPLDDSEMQMVRTAFDEAFANFNVMSVVWIIIVFILGFIFYSLIGGLFGATVSRIEDLQSAMQPMTLIGVLGFYLAYIAPAFYLPISSPFALPAIIISGDMDTLGIAVSVLILAAFCVLMLMFVSRVYEAIIMSTGNRVKIGMLIKLAKK
jgi:ABC-2 type transport system permease protein